MAERNIKVGFAKVDITPPLGVCMAGYFSRREATGILDPLLASALAISDGTNEWILISCDLIGIGDNYIDEAKKLIVQTLDISSDNIMIHSTHTHTGPVVRKGIREEGNFSIGETDEDYMQMLERKLADVAQMALDNIKEATVHVGYGSEDSISFIRRYRMKDGSIKTNPGIGNPDIVEPIGEIDPTVGVICFKFSDRSGEILLVNFALHPDIIGGTHFSADYPGHMRREVSRHIPNCEVMYVNGAAGDINHIDALHPGYTSKGYEYSNKVGNILGAEVLKIYQRLQPMNFMDKDNKDIVSLCSASKEIEIPLRKVTKSEEVKARELVRAFKEGKWQTKDMSGVAEIAAAYQTLKLARVEGDLKFKVQVITIGNIAFVGLPGEVFVDIGRKIKEGSPYENTFISSLSNGSFGYFPTKKAFSEGGYETKNNPFTSELEDLLVEASIGLLNNLKT